MPEAIADSDQVRAQIVAAAEERFRHYGYTKTTMAEIAQDVAMSAANLYRYFKNKQNIAEACAVQCFLRLRGVLRATIHKAHPSAAARLREFALAMLRHTYTETKDHPKINELVMELTANCPPLVHQRNEMVQSLVVEILAEGNRRGEFEVDDLLQTSATIVTALALFGLPMTMHFYSLEEFEDKARRTAELIVKGIAKR